jgi:hypothetical protein
MSDQNLIRTLKIIMLCGLALLLLGHYLWSGLQLQQTMGVPGIILIGLCCALGLILSLPTKIYLTILLMQREQQLSAPADPVKLADPLQSVPQSVADKANN